MRFDESASPVCGALRSKLKLHNVDGARALFRIGRFWDEVKA